jgi:hypothetical protein
VAEYNTYLASAFDSPTIFISYRRADEPAFAGRLRDRLIQRFAPDRGRSFVFMDVSSIEAGDQFPSEINMAVRLCSLVLVVIGRNWLQGGWSRRSRLEDPRDFVAQELDAALYSMKKFIPVLVDGATMPPASHVPEHLRGFLDWNAWPITNARFDTEVEGLMDRIEYVLGVS